MYTEQEVLAILSHDHIYFCCLYYKKDRNDLTPEEIVAHWVRYHPQPKVIHRFTVTPNPS